MPDILLRNSCYYRCHHRHHHHHVVVVVIVAVIIIIMIIIKSLLPYGWWSGYKRLPPAHTVTPRIILGLPMQNLLCIVYYTPKGDNCTSQSFLVKEQCNIKWFTSAIIHHCLFMIPKPVNDNHLLKSSQLATQWNGQQFRGKPWIFENGITEPTSLQFSPIWELWK